MLKPEARAALSRIAESSNGFKQDGDSFTLSGLICCDDESYWSCRENDDWCVYVGPGCPA